MVLTNVIAFVVLKILQYLIYFSNQVVFLHEQKVKKKFEYFENKNFSSFLKGFQMPKIVSDLRGRL